MTGLEVERARLALAPLRQALLASAQADVARELAEAQRQATALVTRAEARAEKVLAAAVSAGKEDAEAVITARRNEARRQARMSELATQREAYDELRRQVADHLARLAADPQRRERLANQVHQLLGPAATVQDAPGGGVIGRSPGRQVDLGVRALADRAVHDLGGELAGLWTP